MKGKDSTIFQVIASDIEEKQREVPAFKEEDVILVMQQASVSREKAIQPSLRARETWHRPYLALPPST